MCSHLGCKRSNLRSHLAESTRMGCQRWAMNRILPANFLYTCQNPRFHGTVESKFSMRRLLAHRRTEDRQWVEIQAKRAAKKPWNWHSA
jgi:hypothetical protein